jgi:hypothetical protein
VGRGFVEHYDHAVKVVGHDTHSSKVKGKYRQGLAQSGFVEGQKVTNRNSLGGKSF